MPDFLIYSVPWVVGLVGFFSFLAVQSWSTERRKEREALYRSEAIKKIAEMRGDTPEPVLQALREAMAQWREPQIPFPMGPAQAREFYRNQTLQKIAAAGGGDAALSYLREQQQIYARRTRDGLRLGGLITLVTGFTVAFFLHVVTPPNPPIYWAGLIPATIGILLFGASFFVESGVESKPR